MRPSEPTAGPRGFFGLFGLLLARLRFFVVLFWIVVAVAVYFYTEPLDRETTGRVSDLVPQEAPAVRVKEEAERKLSGPVEPPAVLVFSDPRGFDASDVTTISAALDRLNGARRPYRLERAVPLVAGDPSSFGPNAGVVGREALAVLLFFERGISPTGVGTGVSETRAVVEDLSGGLVAEVTGAQPMQDDNEAAIKENLTLVTAATALAIFLIVAFAYRSPVAPLVPLSAIGLSIFLTMRLLSKVAENTGTEIPSQVEPIITVLLFGVGTDYTLFLLSRTRRALAEGASKVEAARLGVEGVGGVLLSSAVVLISAFALLVFADLGLYTALGPGLALALTTVFAVVITLVPALLAVLGRAAFGGVSGPRAPRRASVVAPLRRPALTVLVLCVMLGAFAAGTAGLRVGFDQVENLPDDAPSVRGYELLERGFPPGVLAPVNVLVRGEGVAYEEEGLRRLESAMLGSGGFAAALGPDDGGLLPGVNFAAGDGDAVRYLLVFYGAPYTPEALDQIGRLQNELPQMLKGSGLENASATVGGQTALAAAARDTSEKDLLGIAPLVFGASYLVLALLLGTPVAPVYLLLSTVLSFFATVGFSTLLFQGLLGHGGVVYYVPFALFLLLVALGSDYNIFIMAAIREEARERPLSEAVPLALRNTGPTISAAGIALASSFALLALIPLQDFFQVGVAVALGILLDAFVIRTLLVPALVLVFGRAGFWPSKVRS